ncbi:MAG: CDP-diacylglycerol--glycerol-3-phosphate 3-phosphatidyltransferase [Deltaproteobacteria bacterium]|nr:CDP-diacylglycerol--glycerol-3-phosphate 3-phosphatidyltransferase [Deltaproteobacteria bacterium]MBU54477.1 CDP-diacylglycerol--glycerol-3-phosphate 3-phosphatidyltransferase [Deltaproteobacteria bacterium]
MILRNQKKARRARRKQRKKLTLRPPTNFKRELYAIPNILCYFRIILIPVILVLIAYESRWYSYLAAILFSVACITDFFDGYLARKLDQITILGKLLDPLADKLAVAATLIILIPLGRVPGWLVILLLSREFAITGLRGIAASEKMIIASSPVAKYKTTFQMVSIFFLLLHYPYQIHFYGIVSIEISAHHVGLAFLYLSLFFSLVSAADYFWKFAVQINQRYEDVLEENAGIDSTES